LKRRSAFSLTVGTGLATVIGMVGGAPVRSAEASTESVPSSNFLTQSQAIQSGQLNLTVTKNSDGSQRYDYRMQDGATLSMMVPPPNFKPLTATAAQLLEYGFPPRPSSPGPLAAWMSAMAAWKGSPTPSIAFLKKPIAPKQDGSAPLTDSASNGSAANTNWSGWDVNSTSDRTWIGAEGEWQTPNVGAECGNSSVMSIWTGIGGKNSPNLIQTGLAFNDHIPGQVSLWTPFYETLGQTPGITTHPGELYGADDVALTINPGDVVFSKTTYDQSNGSARFFLEDTTTGQSASFTKSGVSGDYDGSTAEMIAEFPLTTVGAQFQSFAIIDAKGFPSGCCLGIVTTICWGRCQLQTQHLAVNDHLQH